MRHAQQRTDERRGREHDRRAADRGRARRRAALPQRPPTEQRGRDAASRAAATRLPEAVAPTQQLRASAGRPPTRHRSAALPSTLRSSQASRSRRRRSRTRPDRRPSRSQVRAGRPAVKTTAPPSRASSVMSPIGYASFVATEREPPVAASTTGRNANAAPSAVVASAATRPSSQSPASSATRRRRTSKTIVA